MTTRVKTRFAPSPSGFLHVGNARIALFCTLLARHAHGVFLLRIEDTDRERCEARYTEAVEEDLRWIGLDWQEGPRVGGAHMPYIQSERTAIYQEYFERLETDGRIYPCFCSRKDVALRERFVAMTPGCTAFAVRFVPAKRRLSSVAKSRFAIFDCP